MCYIKCLLFFLCYLSFLINNEEARVDKMFKLDKLIKTGLVSRDVENCVLFSEQSKHWYTKGRTSNFMMPVLHDKSPWTDHPKNCIMTSRDPFHLGQLETKQQTPAASQSQKLIQKRPEETEEVQNTAFKWMGYYQGIKVYFKIHQCLIYSKSIFRNLILCVLVLGFSSWKVSNPDNSGSMHEGMGLKAKGCVSIMSVPRSIFYDYFFPREEVAKCFPVNAQIKVTPNNYHDRDNTTNKEERNPGAQKDATSHYLLGAKDEQETISNHIHNKTMVREYDRYASFASYEDKMDSISYSPTRLACKGFYFNIEHGLCTCFVCGLEVTQWSETESIDETHHRLSPDCKFINGKETGNIHFHDVANTLVGSIQGSGESSEAKSAAGADGCAAERMRPNDVNRMSRIAKYPAYSTKSDRTASFLSWKRHNAVSASSLVNAGLFFTGTGDEVRCFQCGCGLKNWEQNDDPWVEHAYWVPDCEYVITCKGQEFIDMVQMNRRLDVPSQERHSDSNVTTAHHSVMSKNRNTPPSNITSYELPRQRASSDEGDTVLIKTCVEMGFERELVLLALRNVKKSHTEDTSSLQNEVLEYLLEKITTEQTDISPPTSTSTTMKIKRTQNDKSSKSTNREITSEIDMKHVVEENYALKEQIMCKVCMDRDACVVFLPCGHMVTCEKCAGALRKCAICRARIQGNVKAILY